MEKNWEKTKDPQTGKDLWVNHETKQTSWAPPEMETAQPLPLPEGWEEAQDEQGRFFFINHLTQTTTWDDPRDSQANAKPVLQSNLSAYNTSNGTPEQQSDLVEATPVPLPEDDTFQSLAAAQRGAAAALVLPAEVPDEARDRCPLSGERFTLLNRKHHCKCCGDVVSRGVTEKLIIPLPGDEFEKEKKVCTDCVEHCKASDPECLKRCLLVLRFGDGHEAKAAAVRALAKGLTEAARSPEGQGELQTYLEHVGGPPLFVAGVAGMISADVPADAAAHACECLAGLMALQHGSRKLGEWADSFVAAGLPGKLAAVLGAAAAPGVQEQAARALFYASLEPRLAEAARRARALAPLLDLLTAPEDSVQRWAVATARNLVAGGGAAQARALWEGDGAALLLLLLAHRAEDVRAHALAALSAAIAAAGEGGDEELARRFAEAVVGAEGAVGAVVGMLGNPDARVSGLALELLISLSGVEACCRRIGNSEVVGAFVSKLQETPPPPTPTQRGVLLALGNLLAVARGGLDREAVEAGALEAAVARLQSPDAGVCEQASRVLARLAANREFTALAAASGALQALLAQVLDPAMAAPSPVAGGGLPLHFPALRALVAMLPHAEAPYALEALNAGVVGAAERLLGHAERQVQDQAALLLHALFSHPEKAVLGLALIAASGTSILGRLVAILEEGEEGGGGAAAGSKRGALLALGSMLGAPPRVTDGVEMADMEGKAEVVAALAPTAAAVAKMAGGAPAAAAAAARGPALRLLWALSRDAAGARRLAAPAAGVLPALTAALRADCGGGGGGGAGGAGGGAEEGQQRGVALDVLSGVLRAAPAGAEAAGALGTAAQVLGGGGGARLVGKALALLEEAAENPALRPAIADQALGPVMELLQSSYPEDFDAVAVDTKLVSVLTKICGFSAEASKKTAELGAAFSLFPMLFDPEVSPDLAENILNCLILIKQQEDACGLLLSAIDMPKMMEFIERNSNDAPLSVNQSGVLALELLAGLAGAGGPAAAAALGGGGCPVGPLLALSACAPSPAPGGRGGPPGAAAAARCLFALAELDDNRPGGVWDQIISSQSPMPLLHMLEHGKTSSVDPEASGRMFSNTCLCLASLIERNPDTGLQSVEGGCLDHIIPAMDSNPQAAKCFKLLGPIVATEVTKKPEYVQRLSEMVLSQDQSIHSVGISTLAAACEADSAAQELILHLKGLNKFSIIIDKLGQLCEPLATGNGVDVSTLDPTILQALILAAALLSFSEAPAGSPAQATVACGLITLLQSAPAAATAARRARTALARLAAWPRAADALLALPGGPAGDDRTFAVLVRLLAGGAEAVEGEGGEEEEEDEAAAAAARTLGRLVARRPAEGARRLARAPGALPALAGLARRRRRRDPAGRGGGGDEGKEGKEGERALRTEVLRLVLSCAQSSLSVRRAVVEADGFREWLIDYAVETAGSTDDHDIISTVLVLEILTQLAVIEEEKVNLAGRAELTAALSALVRRAAAAGGCGGGGTGEEEEGRGEGEAAARLLGQLAPHLCGGGGGGEGAVAAAVAAAAAGGGGGDDGLRLAAALALETLAPAEAVLELLAKPESESMVKDLCAAFERESLTIQRIELLESLGSVVHLMASVPATRAILVLAGGAEAAVAAAAALGAARREGCEGALATALRAAAALAAAAGAARDAVRAAAKHHNKFLRVLQYLISDSSGMAASTKLQAHRLIFILGDVAYPPEEEAVAAALAASAEGGEGAPPVPPRPLAGSPTKTGPEAPLPKDNFFLKKAHLDHKAPPPSYNQLWQENQPHMQDAVNQNQMLNRTESGTTIITCSNSLCKKELYVPAGLDQKCIECPYCETTNSIQ